MDSIPVILAPQDTESEGIFYGEDLHALTCPCAPCQTANEPLPPLSEEESAERWATFQADNAERKACLDARDWADGMAFWHKCLNAAEDAREFDDQDRRNFRHTLPIVVGAVSEIPAVLVRSDGETLLYEGRLNSIFGEPGMGKSWVALMAVIQALRSGARVAWWDHEDRPGTLAARLKALGAEELIGPNLVYVTPDLVEDPLEIAVMAQWLRRGDRPGLVVIDSVESAGCPTDSNNVGPWFNEHVDPFLDAGNGVLLLDHIPKRREDRPRGAIGSQHKLARLDGAGLYIDGKAWSKLEGGKVVLRNHKDRLGDLPAGLKQPVATVTVAHENDLLIWTIDPPDDDEDDLGEVTGNLLSAIADKGQEGVKGSTAIRGLVKAKGHKLLDKALADLISNGMVARRKEGRAFVYFATETGMDMSSDDDDSED